VKRPFLLLPIDEFNCAQNLNNLSREDASRLKAKRFLLFLMLGPLKFGPRRLKI
jgi:hypothetical protein